MDWTIFLAGFIGGVVGWFVGYGRGYNARYVQEVEHLRKQGLV